MTPLNGLTNQEKVVLSLVAKGWRNMKIASELCISIRTVENHLYHIFDKLNVSTRTEAAVCALQKGGLLRAEMSGISDDTVTRYD
jgi:DNA-binding NarL/FixJ family response regulator